mmetsp:Transcript_108/g.363  ORF Transcript_108/g.363 Transcript_108/m.363 type:complete len:391 (-) Transcript_108:1960-3132(-)
MVQSSKDSFMRLLRAKRSSVAPTDSMSGSRISSSVFRASSGWPRRTNRFTRSLRTLSLFVSMPCLAKSISRTSRIGESLPQAVCIARNAFMTSSVGFSPVASKASKAPRAKATFSLRRLVMEPWSTPSFSWTKCRRRVTLEMPAVGMTAVPSGRILGSNDRARSWSGKASSWSPNAPSYGSLELYDPARFDMATALSTSSAIAKSTRRCTSGSFSSLKSGVDGPESPTEARNLSFSETRISKSMMRWPSTMRSHGFNGCIPNGSFSSAAGERSITDLFFLPDGLAGGAGAAGAGAAGAAGASAAPPRSITARCFIAGGAGACRWPSMASKASARCAADSFQAASSSTSTSTASSPPSRPSGPFASAFFPRGNLASVVPVCFPLTSPGTFC